MALVKSLFQRFIQNKRKAREEHDVWKLYHLLYYNEQSGGKEVRVPRPPEVSYHEQYRLVHAMVTKQLISRLRGMSGDMSTPSSPSSSVDCSASSSPPYLTQNASHQALDISGVNLRGRVVAGTVLCFFPGTVYLPTDLEAIPGFPDIGGANPYLMSCSDGSVIDAMPYTSTAGADASRSQGVLAEGHMIRHPRPDQEANVVPFSYNVDPTFPNDLLVLIPNKYYKYPGLLYYSSSPMRTIVFVATRHIQNEELLLNYRLHPDSELPSWYVPQDSEEARERWKY